MILQSAALVTLKRTIRDAWRAGRVGTGLAVLIGLAALLLRTPLERWSFDWPHALQPETKITNVAIVFMDDISHTRLHQPYDGPWDRTIHAELVDVLTKAGAPVVKKLRDALNRLRVSTPTGSIPLTLSLGTATVPGFPPVTSAAELLRVADKRMYEAKRVASSGKSHPR